MVAACALDIEMNHAIIDIYMKLAVRALLRTRAELTGKGI